MIPQKRTSIGYAALLLAASLLATGCKAPQPFGERDSVILRADAELWQQVEPVVRQVLERTVYTSRPERIFTVTFVAVGDTLWDDMRLFQQVVVMGSRQDEVVARLADSADRSDAQPPAVLQARDVWARNQLVTVLLLPEGGQAEAVSEALPRLFARLYQDYDDWITRRMYTTGVNDSLGAALQEYGFTLQVPNVYEVSVVDRTFRFANPYRMGESDLLRSLVLTWREGTQAVTVDSLRAWRERIDETIYDPPHDFLDEGARFDTLEVANRTALEFRGVWQDRSEFPAAGPFVARAVICPGQGRTYYMDGWIYAPGQDKYPYMRQVEILMDSFRCADEPAPATAAGAVASR